VDALDDGRASFDEPDPALGNGIGRAVIVGVIVAAFLAPREAPVVLAFLLAGALVLMLVHSYQVDRSWQGVLDDLAAAIPD
jgi:hypothetical protein